MMEPNKIASENLDNESSKDYSDSLSSNNDANIKCLHSISNKILLPKKHLTKKNNSATSISKQKKITKGRQKLKIELIKDINRRKQIMSRRKGGLIKKTKELNILTGLQTMTVIYSRDTKKIELVYTDDFEGLAKSTPFRIQLLACVENNKRESSFKKDKII